MGDNTIYAYHATNPKNIDSISQSGLLSEKGGYGSLYLAPTEEGAVGYGGSKASLLRVNKSKLPTDYVEAYGEKGAGSLGEIKTKGNIPPEFLEIKINGEWKPLSELSSTSQSLTNYYTPSTNLAPEKKAIEDRFLKQLTDNTDEEIVKYHKKFGNELNTDNVRELSPDYELDRTNSTAVHEPASAFTKVIYKKMLSESDPTKTNIVLFTAGGTGAGKSTAIKNIPNIASVKDKAQLIYDTNLNKFSSAVDKIDMALDANKKVAVAYVFADPVKAFDQSVERAIRMGRTVPISEHVLTHEGSYKTIYQLADHYKDNPNFGIYVIDNTRGKGEAIATTLDSIKGKEYNVDALKKELYDKLEQKYKNKEISEKLYKGFNDQIKELDK